MSTIKRNTLDDFAFLFGLNKYIFAELKTLLMTVADVNVTNPVTTPDDVEDQGRRNGFCQDKKLWTLKNRFPCCYQPQ